jgi:hypothetical protein
MTSISQVGAKEHRIGGVLAGVVTAVYVVVLAQVFPPGGREAPVAPLFLGTLLVMGALGLALGKRARFAWPIVLFGFVGIVVGVLANAIYDAAANHIDHNLFPFEIVIAAVLIMPG